MTGPDVPATPVVPAYATHRNEGPDWQLFAILATVFTVGIEVFGLVCYFFVPRIMQILRDFKIALPVVTDLLLRFSVTVALGGYIYLLPLPLIAAFVIVQVGPHTDDLTVRLSFRRRVKRLAILAVALLLGLYLTVVALAFLPILTSLTAVSGQQAKH